MGGLTNLKKRLDFYGGKIQNDRIIEDKLRSLESAILSSYQSGVVELSDKRQFRCLINPDQINHEYDNKFLSIPYNAICLNDEDLRNTLSEEEYLAFSQENGIHKIPIAAGDVIQWMQNNTYWIVYLQELTELAYFRAELRKCKYEININNQTYKVAVNRDFNKTVTWNGINDIHWNDLEYTIEMLVKKDENTASFFKRFAKVKLDGRQWEVQGADAMDIDGIIVVALKEYYSNTIEDEENSSIKPVDPPIDPNEVQIDGNQLVYPYEIHEYTIKNNTIEGFWEITTEKAKIISQNNNTVQIKILTGRSGSFVLSYKNNTETVKDLLITIASL